MLVANMYKHGGAMLLHEDTSEYDINAKQPEINPELATKVQKHIIDTAYDPVDKVIRKTRLAYDELYHIMKEIDIRNTDRPSMIEDCDTIAKTATYIADMMRAMLTKMRSMANLINDDWIFEDFKTNMKFILTNSKRITELGYASMKSTTNDLSDFFGYDTEKIISVYIDSNKNELPVYPFELHYVDGTGLVNGKFLECFSNMEDMLKCFFEDIERLYRLETEHVCTYDLQSLVNHSRHFEPICSSDDNYQFNYIIRFISDNLRKIKTYLYDLQVLLVDNREINPEYYYNMVRRCISGTADIFYISFIYLVWGAYGIRRGLDLKKDVNEYINMLKGLKL